MYAIIQAGSRQFRVKQGDVIHVDLLDAQPGQQVDLNNVLLLSRDDGSVTLGAPSVPGCVVKAEYVAEVKGPKITSLKYKKRKNEYRKFGHRQRYAQLKIVDIQA
jgi:large subunit ribosomal protein L21